MRLRLRTRFWGTLFALVGVLAATGAVVLVALRRLAAADAAAEAAEHAKHEGHHTAALVRDMYIHQTHVVLGEDPSHLDHYVPIVAAARVAAATLHDEAASIGLGEPAAVLPARIEAIDDEFRRVTLPAVALHDRATVAGSTAAVQALVDETVARIDELNARLEAHADDARGAAVSAGRNASVAILSALGIATVLALLFGVLLARSITRPLDGLAAGAARLAAGEREARVTPAGDVELAALAVAFNRMAEQLARDEQRLVEARKLAALGRLAAGVAHEINNPLAVVLGRTRLLRDRLAATDAAAELDVVLDEAEQCRRIVADLLSLAQARAERAERIELGPLLADAVARARATAVRPDAEGLELRVELPPGVGAALGEPGRVRQIVDNLVRNALEACRGRVRVRGADARTPGGDAAVRVEVEDDGAGVPAADRGRLFEPFFTTKPGGTGLGLAISLAVARAQGGELAVEEGDLGGARFVLTLPA